MSSKITVIVAIATAAMLGTTTLAGDSITNSESRVCALETFAQTNLLLATKNGDYKLVQCVSDKLQEQRNETLDKNRNEWGWENRILFFKIGLSVLQTAASMHDWKVEPYNAYPDISRLIQALSKDATYHDAKQTELPDISNPSTRAELEKYRNEKKRMIERSQSEFALHRICKQKIRELRQEMQSVCKANPEEYHKALDAVDEIVTNKELKLKLLEGVKHNAQTAQEK